MQRRVLIVSVATVTILLVLLLSISIVSLRNHPVDSISTEPNPDPGPDEQTNTPPIEFDDKIGEIADFTIKERCTLPGHVALTFDDGPTFYTAQLLDLIDELRVKWGVSIKVTFFVLGVQLLEYPHTAIRAYNSGHQLASHSWNHMDFSLLDKDQVNQQVYDFDQEISGLIGKVPRYFRFPKGEASDENVQQLGAMGHKMFRWGIPDVRDWEALNSTTIEHTFQDVLGNMNPKTDSWIPLLHDRFPTTISAMRVVFEDILSRGYTISTVEECMGQNDAYI